MCGWETGQIKREGEEHRVGCVYGWGYRTARGRDSDRRGGQAEGWISVWVGRQDRYKKGGRQDIGLCWCTEGDIEQQEEETVAGEEGKRDEWAYGWGGRTGMR